MAEQAKFKCLRCGHKFIDTNDAKVMRKRSYPKCASNNIRRIKGKQ